MLLGERGMDAYNNPGFYRQLGKNPEQLIASALELLARRFGL
jgi:organic hydroperoxide reductase OsmC/OhrA